MKVLFAGIFCENSIAKSIQKNTNQFPYAQYKFENMLIQGFNHNKCDYKILSTMPINRWPKYKKILVKMKGTDSRISYLTFINLPIIKQFSILISYITNIFSWCYKNKTEEKIVLVYGTNPINSIPFMFLRKLLRFKIHVIISEINDYSYFDTKSTLNKVKRNIYLFFMHRLQNNYDGYILFSKYMNDILNTKKRPYIIIETMGSVKKIDYIPYKYREKKVIYAGGIYRKYGINKLIEAFLSINLSEYTLELYGNGDYVKELIEISKRNARIFYGGTVSNEEILSKERNAYLLVNPRPSDEMITKYSFPSKTTEYFSSGTTCLITRLDGIPPEYYNYCFTFDDETIEGIAKTLKNVLSFDIEEMEEISKKAYNYISDKKNYIVQTRKIIDFFQTCTYQ